MSLMRWWQWYKNLLVFIAVFFAGEMMNTMLLYKAVLAFMSLNFISSTNYIINDITDIEEDKKHPEKKKRPLASGAVSISEAMILACVLFILSIVLAYLISKTFIIFPLMLMTSTTAYSYFLKNIPILDVHVIAFNFVIRAVAGAYAVERRVSPWLVVVVFFIALFLAVGKRKGDYMISKGASRKKIYDVYTTRFLDSLLTIIASCLLISYSIYTFNSPAGEKMMFTIPFASFLIFRYYHLAEKGEKAGRRVEYLFKDWQWFAVFVLWVIASFIIIYFG